MLVEVYLLTGLGVVEVIEGRLYFLNLKIFINGGVRAVAGGVLYYIICMIAEGVRIPLNLGRLIFIKILN